MDIVVHQGEYLEHGFLSRLGSKVRKVTATSKTNADGSRKQHDYISRTPKTGGGWTYVYKKAQTPTKKPSVLAGRGKTVTSISALKNETEKTENIKKKKTSKLIELGKKFVKDFLEGSGPIGNIFSIVKKSGGTPERAKRFVNDLIAPETKTMRRDQTPLPGPNTTWTADLVDYLWPSNKKE